MKQVSQWLDNQHNKYLFEVRQTKMGNSFIDVKYEITDPESNGLPFTIFENDQGSASILWIDEVFRLPRMTVAEGFSPSALMMFGERILAGTLPLQDKDIIGRPYLDFRSESIREFGTIPFFYYLFNKNTIHKRIGEALNGYKSKTEI